MRFSVSKLCFCGLILLALSSGCASGPDRRPLTTVERVDLDRFMGDWYVIANIPTFVEKKAFNAVESYSLNDDGTIATTFTFNKGSFTGKKKTYRPRGFVRDTGSNAVWGMRFIWPFKGDYRIAYLEPDYSLTVIARQKRDYVWIMARQPVISEETYQRALEFVGAQGYDTSKVQKVPQQVR